MGTSSNIAFGKFTNDMALAAANKNANNKKLGVNIPQTAAAQQLAVLSPDVTELNLVTVSGKRLKNNEEEIEKNVLNNYRSLTHNFTMAALSMDEVNDPNSYRSGNLTRVILKSGGKGPNAINITNDSNKDLIKGFNENSPGRFDMFIDNVEIESLMTFTKNSSVSLTSSLRFDIFEPYSISGFIEAIQVAAVSAGYPSYIGASFVLKMEFIGYPDNVSIEESKPITIPDSVRYFVFRFNSVSVDITEQGTRYKCAATPWNQAGFGEPNKLKKPIKIVGKTVREILTNFKDSLNEQLKDEKKSSTVEGTTDVEPDEYDIVFLRSETSNVIDIIANSEISEFQKGNENYDFPEAQDTTGYDGQKVKKSPEKQPAGKTQFTEKELEIIKKDAAKHGIKNPIINFKPTLPNSSKPTVNFREAQAIHECIAAVIRDSEFGKAIVKNIGIDGTPGEIDDYGFINYFLINIEMTNLGGINKVTRKPRQKYTYVISSYKVHYTNVPNYANQIVNVDLLIKNVVLRNYNYIYTGKNVDVLNFKIQFNNLFFEAATYAMGNSNNNRGTNNLNPDNLPSPKLNNLQDPQQRAYAKGIFPTSTRTVTAESSDATGDGGKSGGFEPDPFSVMSKNMHEAIINSPVGMVTGEIEILGDPFFLVTGGIGNYNPDIEKLGKTVNGESAYNRGEVYVSIKFRNPIDISKFEENGLVYFSEENTEYSGVYKVNRVTSNFRNGLFTQRLEITRLPGQTRTGPSDDAKQVMITKPDSNNQSNAEINLPRTNRTLVDPETLNQQAVAPVAVSTPIPVSNNTVITLTPLP